MANIKSQIKRNRQNEARHERNKAVRSELKTRVKKTNAALASGEAATDLYRETQRKLDAAAAKGVIHPKAAARRKSRLAKKVAAAG
jgi:small subunit ribosomal protein S20